MTMMGSDFYFRDKIPVAVLGATEELGQTFVQLLLSHPWFEIVALCETEEKFIGLPYGDVITWSSSTSLPEFLSNMPIQSCEFLPPCSLIFSALPSHSARTIEIHFAEAGYKVISCSSAHEGNKRVPLVVAEVNPEHLALLHRGGIVANPDSRVRALALVLKPLMESFGLEAVQVVTLQPSNPRFEQESLKILGVLGEEGIQEASFKMSAQCNQVGGIQEDEAWVSVKFKQQVKPEEIIQAWRQFKSEHQRLHLPTASFHPLIYLDPSDFQKNIPSPRNKERTVNVGQLHSCSVLDHQFILWAPSTLRGRGESALLIAELLVTQGKIYW